MMNKGSILNTKNPSWKKFQEGRCAPDGNRTRTDISVHGILSPACLPIPPPERSGCKYSQISGNSNGSSEISYQNQAELHPTTTVLVQGLLFPKSRDSKSAKALSLK